MKDLQENVYTMVQKAICGSVKPVPVLYDAIKVTTPFIDWVGENFSIYITAEGEITDGETTLNQIRAMRVFEEFEKLKNKSDYFEDFNIKLSGGSLEPEYLETSEDIIRYIQGVARLPTLFKVDPLSDKDDRFPTLVRNTTMEILMEYPSRPLDEDVFKWAYKISHPYLISTRSGIKIHSDMRPVNKNKNVQIIGMVNSPKTQQDAHVASKLYNPLYLKQTNRNVRTIIVVNDISKYSENSQNAIKEEANPLIQYKDGKKAKMDLAAQVAEAS
jgi:DNA-directed RNA polymerase subunit L